MTLQRIASGGLKITALEIRNLWGVAEAVIRPGKRNIIRGPNGTGKSSLLNAVQLALGGGSLGKYQRLGAEEPPQIVLEIAGPDDFIRVEREGDKPPKVLRRVGESEAFEKVSAPASFLKGLFDVRGANPFAFLAASDDDRAQLLLEALDLELDEDELWRILGDDTVAELAREVPDNLHPLVRIALIHDAVYKARRGMNVDRDSKLKAAEQLKRSVPAERIPDAKKAIAELESTIERELGVIERSEEAARSKAREDKTERERSFRAEKERLEALHEQLAARLRAEVEERIRQDREQVNQTIEALRTELARDVDRAGDDERAALRQAQEEREALSRKKQELAQLRERQAEAERHENTRRSIASFEAAAEEHESESKRLTGVLRELEAFKRRLVEKLPIEGLDISGKEIRVNAVPWRDLNKAQQGAIAGIVAVERAKKSRLPVVFFDEAEQFDEAHIDAIAEIVESAGAQLFAAVVAREGELSVEADGAPAGEVDVDAPSDPVVSGRKR